MNNICEVLALATLSLTVISCNSGTGVATSGNPSRFITDSAKIEMVHSLKSVDGTRFLEMDYTMDYDADAMLEANISSFEGTIGYMVDQFLDVRPEILPTAGIGTGCSAFAATDPVSSDFYFGRNYDFCHIEKDAEVPISAIIVRTAPKNGKKAISIVDSYWLGYHDGFYTDGSSDLSMLMGAPFTVLDGMNEDGFAMGILHLLGNPTAQADPAKKSLWCNTLIRYLLDKAGSVDEALELVKNINVNMVNPALGNNHFFLADASGNYAILEYSFEEGEKNIDEATPDRMVVLQGQDHSYVTNFYVDPSLADNDYLGGKSLKGKYRYDIIQGTLRFHGYKLTHEQAIDLLKAVSQDANPEENTSHTQWSALYNLTERSVDVSVLQDFKNSYSFSLK